MSTDSPPKVLIAEDDAFLRALLDGVLRPHFPGLKLVSNGFEAIAYLEANAVDVLVTSEPAYGDEIARRLGARHILLDPDRQHVPVSGSAIRADPASNLQWLDEPVRRWYEASLE